MYLIYVDKNGNSRDITAITSNYSRSDNADALGMDFKFDLLSNPLDAAMAGKNLDVGGKVIFINDGSTVFSGILTDLSENGLSKKSWTAYDYAFYLNKSEEMMQFNAMAASKAVAQVCEKQSIPVGSICDMPTTITKIYNGNTVADIIKDICKQYTNETGNKVRLEVRDNQLYIEKYEDLILSATYTPASSAAAFDVTNWPGDFSATYSIAEMKNRVMVVSSKEKATQVLATQESADDIKTFGLLQHIEKVDDKNASQAGQIAKTKLQEMNRIKTSRKVKVFGDDNIRAGRSLVFNQPNINLVGTFFIKNCTHTYSNLNHFMELDLDAL